MNKERPFRFRSRFIRGTKTQHPSVRRENLSTHFTTLTPVDVDKQWKIIRLLKTKKYNTHVLRHIFSIVFLARRSISDENYVQTTPSPIKRWRTVLLQQTSSFHFKALKHNDNNFSPKFLVYKCFLSREKLYHSFMLVVKKGLFSWSIQFN